MSGAPTRAGFTLVELIVSLAVLGISAGLGTVAFRSLIVRSDEGGVAWADQVREARRSAVMDARPVVLRSGDGAPVLLLPDGRVVGDGMDLLTGGRELQP